MIKQRWTDCSLGYDGGDLSIGYGNGLWPVADMALPPSQSPQPRQHLENMETVGWLVVNSALGLLHSKGPF